jgi:hypothetical protein
MCLVSKVGSEELGSNLEKQMRSAKPIMIMKAPFLQVTLIQPLVVRMLCFGLGECIGHPVRSGYCLTLQPVGSEELGSNLEKQMRSAKPIMIMKAPFLQVTKGNDPLFTWLGALIQPLVVRMLCFGLGECIGHPVRSGYCPRLKHGMLARQVIHYVSQDGPVPNHLRAVEQLCTIDAFCFIYLAWRADTATRRAYVMFWAWRMHWTSYMVC